MKSDEIRGKGMSQQEVGEGVGSGGGGKSVKKDGQGSCLNMKSNPAHGGKGEVIRCGTGCMSTIRRESLTGC